jgi:rhodanese-related sulfurtransferase
MKTTSMGQLGEIYENLPEGEIILDVRTSEEFAEGHIPGSTNVPHDQLLPAVADLKTKSTIYIHCKAGGRAQAAFQTLTDAGISSLVCVADGGFKDWAQAGLPVETGK